VLDLRAHLADDNDLEARFRPRLPAENRVGALTHMAGATKGLPSHAHVGVVSKTCLAEDGKLRVLPALLCGIRFDPVATFAEASHSHGEAKLLVAGYALATRELIGEPNKSAKTDNLSSRETGANWALR
jgi:hypothetical protein